MNTNSSSRYVLSRDPGFFLLIFFLSMSGCISISTHEQAMKKYRDNFDELQKSQARVVELEAALKSTSAEKEALRGEITDVRGTYDRLVQELKENIASGEVGVKETEKGLTITMGNQILFASGQSELQPRGRKVLGQIAEIIKKNEDRLVQVEGHTDNVPITGSLKSRYPSNWELSAARSAAVVRFLQVEGKLDPKRLVLTAYADSQPLESNSTPEGRQANRRVEITLVPKS